MTVVIIVVVAVLVLGVVGLYVWTRRSERDIEIPERVLTEAEQQQRTVTGAAITNIAGQGGAFN